MRRQLKLSRRRGLRVVASFRSQRTCAPLRIQRWTGRVTSSVSPSEVLDKVEVRYPGRGRAILAALQRRTPRARPFDIWSRVASAPVRQAAIAQARSKGALHQAPAYLYWFTWQTPILDDRPRAFHCAEIPFVFDNVERCENMTGGGREAPSLGGQDGRLLDTVRANGRPEPQGNTSVAERFLTVNSHDALRCANAPCDGS
jgi:hypothetical protein